MTKKIVQAKREESDEKTNTKNFEKRVKERARNNYCEIERGRAMNNNYGVANEQRGREKPMNTKKKPYHKRMNEEEKKGEIKLPAVLLNTQNAIYYASHSPDVNDLAIHPPSHMTGQKHESTQSPARCEDLDGRSSRTRPFEPRDWHRFRDF